MVLESVAYRCLGWGIDEAEALRATIHTARGDADELRLLYERLVDEVGADRASSLWWAAFAAEDAPITG